MIKIMLDQNMPVQTLEWLKEKVGHKVETSSTRLLGMQRLTDKELFRYCQVNNFVVITYDDDFQNP